MLISLEIQDRLVFNCIASGMLWARRTWAKECVWKEFGNGVHGVLALSVVETDDGGRKGTLHTRHMSTLPDAVTSLARISPIHFGDIIRGMGDMHTGDALIQCWVFGELKYA